MHSGPWWTSQSHAPEETGRRNDSIFRKGEQEVSSWYKAHRQLQIQETKETTQREGNRAILEDFLKEGVL